MRGGVIRELQPKRICLPRELVGEWRRVAQDLGEHGERID